MTSAPKRVALLLAITVALGLSGHAAVVNWDGAGVTDNWSDAGAGGNWAGAAMPGPLDTALFTDADTGGTNIVDQNFIIDELSYELAVPPVSLSHTTQIAAGTTLLATGGLGVAPFNGTASRTVDITMTGGAGSRLQVGNPGENTADMYLAYCAYTTGYTHVTGKLDLSAIDAFEANLNMFHIAHGRDWTQRATAELTLAPINTINANGIDIGYGVGRSTILLGQTNTFNTNTLHVGRGKDGHNNMSFQAGLTNPTLTLAGLGGGPADLRICHSSYGTGNKIIDGVDLSGGTFNATLDELTIGIYDQTYTGGCQGSLIIDAGTVTANSVRLAESRGSEVAKTTALLAIRSGSFTVNGNVTDGVGTSTIKLDGGTMTVHGDFAVDNLRVGRDHTATSLGGVATLTVDSGGAVRIGPSGALDIGVRTLGYTLGDPATYGTVDLSGAASANIDATTIRLGTTSGNAASGVLVLADSNTVTASTIYIGDNGITGNAGYDNRITLGTTNAINTDTLYVGRRKSDGTLNFASGLTGASLTLRAADGTGRVNFLGVGINDTNTGSVNTSTMDLSSGSVDALVNTMTIGRHIRTSGSTGKGDGILTLSDDASNSFDVNAITLGQISGEGSPTANGTIQMGGGTFTVNGNVLDGGGGSTLLIDGGTFDVGGDLTVDALRVGHNGRTATVAVGGNATIGASGHLYIGQRNDADYSALTRGTLDLSGATSATLTLDSLRLGISNAIGATGTLLLSPSNTIHAATILMGDNTAGGSGGIQSQIALGAANNVFADTFTIGARKSEAVVDIAPGGVLDLVGETGAATDLRLGYNSISTGSTAIGTLDLSGGTFNATLDDVVLGLHNSGNGAGQGTLLMDAGTVTANSVTLAKPSAAGTSSNPQNTTGTLAMRGGTFAVSGDVLDGGGTSALQVDGGTMTVNGDLKVDALRVGYHDGSSAGNRTGSLTVTGNSVEVGSAANRTDMFVGCNFTSDNVNATGTVDLSGVNTFAATLDDLIIGQRNVGGGDTSKCKASGTVTLAPDTDIDARSILISESYMHGGTPQSILYLGADTTIKTDRLRVAGYRGNALVEFAPGVANGVLTLEGSSGAEADLQVGYCWSGTGTGTYGTMDLMGHTFNATLDELTIGYRVYRGSYVPYTYGTLSFDQGTVTAKAVVIGEGTVSTDPYDGAGIGTLNMDGGTLTTDTIILGKTTAVSKGTLNLSGGTLTAGLIDDGPGTAELNFTGGTLQVGTIGFSLDQQGGILAPGTSPGFARIEGDYLLAAGILEIEANDAADQGDLLPQPPPNDNNVGYDYLEVTGAATLDSTLEFVLLGGYMPTLGTYFDVLSASEILIGDGFALDQSGAGLPTAANTFAWSIIREGNRDFLRLEVVPEPTTCVLFAFGIAPLLRRRRRA